MDELMLARWQFGVTTVYHFFFVPLTLGLSILVAIMQTLYYRTGENGFGGSPLEQRRPGGDVALYRW